MVSSVWGYFSYTCAPILSNKNLIGIYTHTSQLLRIPESNSPISILINSGNSFNSYVADLCAFALQYVRLTATTSAKFWYFDTSIFFYLKEKKRRYFVVSIMYIENGHMFFIIVGWASTYIGTTFLNILFTPLLNRLY